MAETERAAARLTAAGGITDQQRAALASAVAEVNRVVAEIAQTGGVRINGWCKSTDFDVVPFTLQVEIWTGVERFA